MSIRKVEVGDVYRDAEERLWCVIESTPYIASAYSDSWQDYSATLKSVRRDGKLGIRFLQISTYDSLIGYEFVGKAEMSFQVNVGLVESR